MSAHAAPQSGKTQTCGEWVRLYREAPGLPRGPPKDKLVKAERGLKLKGTESTHVQSKQRRLHESIGICNGP